MRIIGIDPGISNVGYAVIDFDKNGYKSVISGSIYTKSYMNVNERVSLIYSGISRVIDVYNPIKCAIEEVFVNKSVRSSIRLAEFRGIILSAAVNHKLEIKEIAPKIVKQAITGFGGATKEQIDRMVRVLIKDVVINSTHESDAYSIAYTSTLM